MTEPCPNLTTTGPALLYGLCGLAGSGKNTVGDLLAEIHGDQTDRLSFAAALKDAVAPIFGLDRALLEGNTSASREWREQPDPYWSAVFNRPMTPRRILQEFGTDAVRTWRDDLWIHALGRQIDTTRTTILTDTRFRNEMQYLRGRNGVLVWIHRPALTPTSETPHFDRVIDEVVRSRAPLFPIQFAPAAKTASYHSSEISFLTDASDLLHIVLINDGTKHRLVRLTQHLDLMLRDRTHAHALGVHSALPYGQTTLYLSSVDGDFVWESHQQNLLRRIVFNTAHHYVLDNELRTQYTNAS